MGIDGEPTASFRGLPELRKCFLSLRCSDQRRHASTALTKMKPIARMTIPPSNKVSSQLSGISSTPARKRRSLTPSRTIIQHLIDCWPTRIASNQSVRNGQFLKRRIIGAAIIKGSALQNAERKGRTGFSPAL
jgi:hypothetical protein